MESQCIPYSTGLRCYRKGLWTSVPHNPMLHWAGALTQKTGVYRRGDGVREQWWEFISSNILQKCTSRKSTGSNSSPPSPPPHPLCRSKVLTKFSFPFVTKMETWPAVVQMLAQRCGSQPGVLWCPMLQQHRAVATARAGSNPAQHHEATPAAALCTHGRFPGQSPASGNLQ